MSIERPNQVWAADLTYVRVQETFVFVAVVLDLYTRSIRGWPVGTTLEEELTRTALEGALAEHGRLEEVGTRLSLSSVGKPTENAICERLLRPLKEEEVYLSEYTDLEDARERSGRFLEEVYMHNRVQSSLGYQTPAEFEAAWRKKEKQGGGNTGERRGKEPKKTPPQEPEKARRLLRRGCPLVLQWRGEWGTNSLGPFARPDKWVHFTERRETLGGHGGGVNCVAFAPDGKTLASGPATSGSVKLWDTDTGKEKAVFPGPLLPRAKFVTFAPDGKTLFAGSVDATLRSWDVATKAEHQPFKVPAGGWEAVAFMADDRTVGVEYTADAIKFWNVTRREELAVFKGQTLIANCVGFTSDGKSLALGGLDGTIKLLDVIAETELKNLPP